MSTDAIVALSRHAIDTRFEDIPGSAIDAARVFLLDSLGVGIAGSGGPYVDELIAADSSEAVSPVLGRRVRLSTSGAALVNAYQIHNSEFDCIHEGAVVHPMAVVLGAVFAWLGESKPAADRSVTGHELLASLVLGVDVACHLGVASRSGLRFFRPATAGAFGATAAIARLSRFDLPQTVNAMGLTLGQLCGTMQAHTEGSPMLAMQVGFNARNAIVACDLAARGVPGPQQVLQGAFGYFELFEREHALEDVLPDVGRIWRICEVAHKPFPSGRATHGVIDACLTLAAEHSLDAGQITRVTADVPSLTHRLVGRRPMTDMAVNYARLCAAFVAARALLTGTVRLSDFSDAARADAKTLALAERITLNVDSNPDPNALTPVSVSIELGNGEVLERSVDCVLGNPRNPLSHEAHLDKFRSNWRSSAQPLDDDAGETLIQIVDRLATQADVDDLNHCLTAFR